MHKVLTLWSHCYRREKIHKGFLGTIQRVWPIIKYLIIITSMIKNKIIDWDNCNYKRISNFCAKNQILKKCSTIYCTNN